MSAADDGVMIDGKPAPADDEEEGELYKGKETNGDALEKKDGAKEDDTHWSNEN